jgi:AcrR family transcriptional regulator
MLDRLMPETATAAAADERAEATRKRIVQAARELVTERGYAGVSTIEVQHRAGVSRGGLYHHFASRQELMAAVIEAIEVDLAPRLAAAISDAGDPLSALQLGAQWYVDECVGSVELQRIGLYEGRQALGWQLWRETIAPYGLAMLVATLDAAMQTGQIVRVDPTALAHVLLAMLHESATMVLFATDRSRERERVGAVVEAVIQGLRAS